MRLSLLARHAWVCCSLAVAPVGAVGQTSYLGGGEYAITGALVGDQVRPSLSVNASGGFLVWQDNATCRYGLGISALALDSNFHGVGAHFRVNKIGFGDDEHPQIALLNNGGAVFVWQGGPQGFQHIYARFMSPTNTWLASDTLVNNTTNRFQVNPVVVCLANGNVAVVWSSYNQLSASSMADVYCQLFSPAGQKLGGEFLVNQFANFNQRTPALAPLSSGGFVVAWVSEQQRNAAALSASGVQSGPNVLPSVDIYARLFGADGSPASDEFLVNSGANVCAHPSIAGASDGTFIVAWDERDMQVYANGLDVLSRPFSSGGVGGTVRRINTWLRGDQFAPQTRVLGGTYLVLWTSMGQDGSREGVFGQFLQPDGSPSGGELRINTAVLGSQKEPALAADNSGRFLAAWTSYVGGASSFDLFAQFYASPGFVPPAGPSHYGPPPPETFIDIAPAVASGVTPNTAVPSGVTLPFPASIGSPPLPDPFSSSQGTYNGLFYDPNGVSAASAGYFTAKVTARRGYSAKLMFGGRSYSVSGVFDSNGRDTKRVRRSGGLSDLSVQLQLARLDAAGGSQLRGTITNRQWAAELMADRLVFSKSGNPANAYKGTYTMTVAPAAKGPDGSGFGTIKIDKGGLVTWSATLADGSKVTQGSALSEQGYWPLYASLYRGGGLVASWMQFNEGGLGAKAIWVKPRGAVAPYFPRAFTNEVNASGSLYTPLLGSRASVLDSFRNSNLSFSGGVLGQPVTKALALDVRGRLLPASELKLSVSLSSGLFKGSTTLLPQPGKVFFQGVILENGEFGAGFFQDNLNRLSGQLNWEPAP